MAKQVGISAVLKFAAGAAIGNMKRASKEFKQLSTSSKMLVSGMGDLRGAVQGIGLAHAAAGAAVGLTVKKFADFDGQMGAVKAVLGKGAAPEFAKLEAMAARLGATTAFTATQAAEAMENLARAGMSPTEIMKAVPEVLAAAAAEGMDLASAADIVASNLKGFQLEATEAGRVADALAFVSAKTNTSMQGLQEGLKFVAPVAKQMGFSVEETAASLGVLADIGLKNTLGGTALKNALLKVADGAKHGFVKVGKFKAQVQDSTGAMLPLNKIMGNIAEKLGHINDPAKRAQAAMELLGLRGMGAAAAFDALGKGKNSAERIATLFGDVQTNAKGAAKEMAAMRLDNLKGQFTLLSSAVDGVVNSIGKALASTLGNAEKGPLTSLTETLGSAAKAFQFFAANSDEVGKNTPIAIEGVSREMTAFVRGFLQGVRDVKETMVGLFGTIRTIGNALGLTSGEGTNGMVRLATKITGVTLALAPLGFALKTTTSLFGPFAKAGMGSFKLIGGLVGGLTKQLGRLGGGILNRTGFAAKLPGVANKLGPLSKAVKGMENITAQPVRVTNFHEAGMGLGGGKGPPPIPGSGGGGATGMAAARQNLGSFVSRFGRVGEFFNSNLKGFNKGVASTSGKLLRLAGAGGALAAVGTAGYALGSWLNEKFGISDKLANGLWNLFNTAEMAASKKRVEEHAARTTHGQAQRMANQLARLSQSGVTSVQTGRGKERMKLTRGMAEDRIRKFLGKQGKTESEIKETLKSLEGTLRGIRDTSETKVVVNVDGKVIAQATGKRRVEAAERGARRPTRRTAAVGAAP